MSIKTERIGSLFTKEIGYILQNETKNKDFKTACKLAKKSENRRKAQELFAKVYAD